MSASPCTSLIRLSELPASRLVARCPEQTQPILPLGETHGLERRVGDVDARRRVTVDMEVGFRC